jgi:hypothetical protein
MHLVWFLTFLVDLVLRYEGFFIPGKIGTSKEESDKN